MQSYDLRRLGYNDGNFYDRAVAKDVYRILSFGGSFTFGITRPEFTFNAYLRKDLGELVKDRRFEVLNLGRPGAGFHDMIEQYSFWSQNIDYDAAVFTLYPGANFEARPDARPEPLRYGPGLFVPRHGMIRMFDYIATVASAALALREEEGAVYFSAFPFPRDVYLQKMIAASKPYQAQAYGRFEHGLANLFRLMRMARDQERRGKRILIAVAGPHFLYAPTLYEAVLRGQGIGKEAIEPLLPGTVTRALAKAAGLNGAVFDLTPCLAARNNPGERLYYKTDTHWSQEGNMLVGELLAERMAADWFGRGTAPACGAQAPPPGSPLARFAQIEAQQVAQRAGAGE